MPVALRDVRSTYPYFADDTVPALAQRIWIHDYAFLIQPGATRAAESRDALSFVCNRNNFIQLERRSLNSRDYRRRRLRATGDKERSLSESITRKESFTAKTARLKGRAESIDRALSNRFGAVKGNSPTAQIEFCSFLDSDLAHAEIVSEVRTTARRGTVTRNRL